MTKHSHLQEVLKHVYKELMMLGFISLTLFFVENVSHLENVELNGEHFDEELFEFAHLFIFFSSIFYIATVLMVLIPMRFEWRRNKKLEMKGNRTRILRTRAEWERQNANVPFYWYIFHPIGAYNYFSNMRLWQVIKTRERFIDELRQLEGEREIEPYVFDDRDFAIDGKMTEETRAEAESVRAFHAKMQIVERKRRLGRIERFNFAKYLRRAVRFTSVTILELDWKVWSIVLIISLSDALRLALNVTFETGDGGVALFISIGWLNLFCFFVLYIDAWRGLNRYHNDITSMTHQSSTEYIALPEQQTLYLLLKKEASFSYQVIKVLLLFQSFYMSLGVLVFGDRISVIYPDAAGLYITLAVLPPFVVVGIFLPLLLPIVSMLSHVEELVNLEHVDHVLKRMAENETVQATLTRKASSLVPDDDDGPSVLRLDDDDDDDDEGLGGDVLLEEDSGEEDEEEDSEEESVVDIDADQTGYLLLNNPSEPSEAAAIN